MLTGNTGRVPCPLHTSVGLSVGNDREFCKQEAFEKCWAHSPLRAAVTLPFIRCHYCRTPAIAIAQAACDVHNNDDNDDNDNNDNARQRGPLWPHGMGPKTADSIEMPFGVVGQVG